MVAPSGTGAELVLLGNGKAGPVLSLIGQRFEQICAWDLADLRSNPHPPGCWLCGSGPVVFLLNLSFIVSLRVNQTVCVHLLFPRMGKIFPTVRAE